MLDIRPLLDEQSDEMVALWRDCGLLRPWNDPHADIALCRRTRGAALFAGFEGALLVAGIMCGFDGHRGWLYYLAVSPARHGCGFGRDMVRHAESWLGAQGCAKVQLMIREENRTAHGFYATLGYEVEPRVLMSRWLAR